MYSYKTRIFKFHLESNLNSNCYAKKFFGYAKVHESITKKHVLPFTKHVFPVDGEQKGEKNFFSHTSHSAAFAKITMYAKCFALNT